MSKKISVFAFVIGLCFASANLSILMAAPGDLYDGGLNSGNLYRFTPSGGSPTVFVALASDWLAFDIKGNLFAAANNRIAKITPNGAITTFTSGLAPSGLAFDAAGILYAGDTSTGKIFKFTPSGGAGVEFASGINGPIGLAFDRSGNLFVSESGTNSILKITPNGMKTVFASGLNSPQGLAFDSNGNLYEANLASNSVLKFSPGGGPPAIFKSSLGGPRSLAFDSNANLFVGEFGSHAIDKIAPNGTLTPFASNVFVGGLAFEPPTAQLTNISTRASVQTGEGVTIGGFILTGTDLKQVVVRGLGPTLGQPPFNVPNVLADPTLQLIDGTGKTIFINDNWKETQQTGIQATGLAPPNDFESAIRIALQPGKYTAILSGKNNTTGVGLVEVYDIEKSVFSALTNVSTRGFVGTDQNVMIGGFITEGGNGSTQIVIRGLGPTLGQPPFNVPNVLADPKLTLVNSNGNIVRGNNNWKDSQQAAIQATGLAPPNDLEAAILVTVAAGRYTAILEGNGGGTGIALVEVYKL